MQRFTRQAMVILRARFLFGLLNMLSAAIAWRAVGPEVFGIIVLLQAYTRLTSSLCRFQTWASVVRYGPDPAAEGDTDRLGRLIGFTLRLDIIGFALTFAVMILAAPLFARWLQFPPGADAMIPLFALSAPFIIIATGNGILQLFEQAGALAWQHALNAIFRFVGVCGIFLFGGGLVGLSVVWVTASILSGAYMIGRAIQELRIRNIRPKLLGRWRNLTEGFDNIWRFSIMVNASSLLEKVVSQLTVLLIGGFLGPAAAGLFGIVRQVTEAIGKLGTVLAPIIFPHVALMASRQDHTQLRRILRRILITFGAGLSSLFLILSATAEPLLITVFDSSAAEGAPLLVVMGAAASLIVVGFALDPIMLSMGRDRELLALAFVVTMVYLVLAIIGLNTVGLIGVGAALLFRQVTMFGGRLWMVNRYLRATKG